VQKRRGKIELMRARALEPKTLGMTQLPLEDEENQSSALVAELLPCVYRKATTTSTKEAFQHEMVQSLEDLPMLGIRDRDNKSKTMSLKFLLYP